jgi:hypothetical protein
MAQNVCRLLCCGPQEIWGQCEESSSSGSARVGQAMAQALFEGHEKYGKLHSHASIVRQHAISERFMALDNALQYVSITAQAAPCATRFAICFPSRCVASFRLYLSLAVSQETATLSC